MAIVTGNDTDCRMPLGSCPSAHDAKIAVDPDKLFGRHLAVLGNTGSGKSCTVAALIRAAVESAKNNLVEDVPNAKIRFIVLDPNGEYSSCFKDLDEGCRVFKVPPLTDEHQKEFKLPAWMWNSSEWAAIAQAAPRTQRPLLQEALRNLRSNTAEEADDLVDLRAKLSQAELVMSPYARVGTSQARESNPLGNYLQTFVDDIGEFSRSAQGDLQLNLAELADDIHQLIREKRWTTGQFNPFSRTEIRSIVSKISELRSQLKIDDGVEINEDMPIRFNVENLADQITTLADLQGGGAGAFISTLTMRLRMLLSDTRMNNVINPDVQPTLREWLENHIGDDKAKNGQITIVDLSLVPYEILHLVIAVASRIIFEALQRYQKLNRKNLPTVLVLEEAHTFVAKRLPHGDEIPSPADMCRQTFERIAREGRKFGLGIVLSSQRPSELSETVLSQCNSFLLHRITNDRDQELVSRLVPDTARGLLRELPSLPTRHCILLGSASKIPVLLEIMNLDPSQRPESEDPDFWAVWTGKERREIDWKVIADEWQGKRNGDE